MPYSPKWQERFFQVAQVVSSWSSDTSTKVGCVLVKNKRIIATGFNGLPAGVSELPSRLERPNKYIYTEHADRNAIYNCAKFGISTEGSTMFLTPLPPCADCARAIIQAGIIEVCYFVPEGFKSRPHWDSSISAAEEMFKEANIHLYKYNNLNNSKNGIIK